MSASERQQVLGTLHLERANGASTCFPCTKPVISFGRLPCSDVRIYDNKVSKMHCELAMSPENSEARLIVHSINGLIFKGKLVKRGDSVIMQSGDRFIIAGRTFKWQTKTQEQDTVLIQTPAASKKIRFSLVNAAKIDTPSRRTSFISSFTSPFNSFFSNHKPTINMNQTQGTEDLMTWSDDELASAAPNQQQDVITFERMEPPSDSSDSDSDGDDARINVPYSAAKTPPSRKTCTRKPSIRMTISPSPSPHAQSGPTHILQQPMQNLIRPNDDSSDEEVEQSLLISPSIAARIPLPLSPPEDGEGDSDSSSDGELEGDSDEDERFANAEQSTPTRPQLASRPPLFHTPSLPVRMPSSLNRKHSLRERVLLKSATKAHHIATSLKARSLSLGNLPLEAQPEIRLERSSAPPRPTESSSDKQSPSMRNVDSTEDVPIDADEQENADQGEPLSMRPLDLSRRLVRKSNVDAQVDPTASEDISEFFISSESSSEDEGAQAQEVSSKDSRAADEEVQEFLFHSREVPLNDHEEQQQLQQEEEENVFLTGASPSSPSVKQELSPRAIRANRRSSGNLASPIDTEQGTPKPCRASLSSAEPANRAVIVHDPPQAHLVDEAATTVPQELTPLKRPSKSPRKSALKSRPSFGLENPVQDASTPSLKRRKSVIFNEEPEIKEIANRQDPAFIAEQEAMRASAKRRRISPRRSSASEDTVRACEIEVEVPVQLVAQQSSVNALKAPQESVLHVRSLENKSTTPATTPDKINAASIFPTYEVSQSPDSSPTKSPRRAQRTPLKSPGRAKRVPTSTPPPAVAAAYAQMHPIAPLSLRAPGRALSAAKSFPNNIIANTLTVQEMPSYKALLGTPIRKLDSEALKTPKNKSANTPAKTPADIRTEALAQQVASMTKPKSASADWRKSITPSLAELSLTPESFGLKAIASQTPTSIPRPSLSFSSSTSTLQPPTAPEFAPHLSHTNIPQFPKTPVALGSVRDLFRAEPEPFDWSVNLGPDLSDALPSRPIQQHASSTDIQKETLPQAASHIPRSRHISAARETKEDTLSAASNRRAARTATRAAPKLSTSSDPAPRRIVTSVRNPSQSTSKVPLGPRARANSPNVPDSASTRMTRSKSSLDRLAEQSSAASVVGRGRGRSMIPSENNPLNAAPPKKALSKPATADSKALMGKENSRMATATRSTRTTRTLRS